MSSVMTPHSVAGGEELGPPEMTMATEQIHTAAWTSA